MNNLIKTEPLLLGYFSDETLEHGERVGLALVTAAENIELKFSRQLLPEPNLTGKYEVTGYSPSE